MRSFCFSVLALLLVACASDACERQGLFGRLRERRLDRRDTVYVETVRTRTRVRVQSVPVRVVVAPTCAAEKLPMPKNSK